LWGVGKQDIIATATRFFQGYKKYSAVAAKQAAELVHLQIKSLLSDASSPSKVIINSDESDPTLYISNVKPFAPQLSEKSKNIVVVGKEFVWGLGKDIDIDPLTAAFEACQVESKTSKRKAVAATAAPAKEKKPLRVAKGIKAKVVEPGQKKPKMVQVDIIEVQGSFLNANPLVEYLTKAGFVEYKC